MMRHGELCPLLSTGLSNKRIAEERNKVMDQVSRNTQRASGRDVRYDRVCICSDSALIT
jgi:IS30 family transposase